MALRISHGRRGKSTPNKKRGKQGQVKGFAVEAVSPKWKIPFPGLGEKSFLLVLHPLAVNDQKHGAGFKKAKGKGTVELKYIEEELRDKSIFNYHCDPKSTVPSDTKLLLTKNYSEIIIFEKLRVSYVIP